MSEVDKAPSPPDDLKDYLEKAHIHVYGYMKSCAHTTIGFAQTH